jgi:hypothetical protein
MVDSLAWPYTIPCLLQHRLLLLLLLKVLLLLLLLLVGL